MSNGKVLYNNLFTDYLTLSVTSEDSDWKKEFLDSPNPRKYCKAGAVGTQNITLDMGSGYAKIAKTAYLGNVNLGSGDTFNFKASTDNFSTEAESQAMTLKTRTINYLEKKAVFCSGLSWIAYQYLRYNLAISADKVEAATPFIARDEIEFAINFQWGYGDGEDVFQQITQGGQGMQYVEIEWSRKRIGMTFVGVTDSQKEEIDLKLRFSPYVVFLPTGTGGNIYYGTLKIGEPIHNYLNNWSFDAVFEELPFDGRTA